MGERQCKTKQPKRLERQMGPGVTVLGACVLRRCREFCGPRWAESSLKAEKFFGHVSSLLNPHGTWAQCCAVSPEADGDGKL